MIMNNLNGFTKLLIVFGFNLLIMTQYSCERIFGGDDDRLKIVNNSNKRIYMSEQLNYPDTAIDSYNPSGDRENNEVLPMNSKRFHSRSWEQLVVRAESDTMMIFIYDADLVDKTPWDSIRKDYNVLRRYHFSLNDLKNIDWTITYP